MSTVFLDRDGVIGYNRPDHVKSWREFRFIPGALAAIRRLSQAGSRLVIVTNQAVVDRGLAPREAVSDINVRMVQSIQANGGNIEAVYYCPHRPEDNCSCRKPKAGMIFEAAAQLRLDLGDSYIVGDHLNDLQAGAEASCKPILVLTGRGESCLLEAKSRFGSSLQIANDLTAAADLILCRTASPGE